ncbi:MAG: hypothetical protein DMG42_10870 [Acidobacteria bacterium]|nr:MAG: hypothetical protein DMG42_10870 [Acidobacteriota bacterium]
MGSGLLFARALKCGEIGVFGAHETSQAFNCFFYFPQCFTGPLGRDWLQSSASRNLAMVLIIMGELFQALNNC